MSEPSKARPPFISRAFEAELHRANLRPLPEKGVFIGEFVSQSTMLNRLVIVRVQPPRRGDRLAWTLQITGRDKTQIGSGSSADLIRHLNIALLDADIQTWREGKADKPDKFNPQQRVRFQ